MRYFDDFFVGERLEGGSATLSEAQIIDFAMMYDPQSFHVDSQAAAESHFGGLIASGFQTIALCFRLFIQRDHFRACSMGGPAIDELRFIIPVRPGDTLRSEAEIVELTPSRSKPDVGIVRYRIVGTNQHKEKVVSYLVTNMLKRRPTDEHKL